MGTRDFSVLFLQLFTCLIFFQNSKVNKNINYQRKKVGESL